MSLREHVFNLLTGVDVPVRHIVLLHLFLPFRPFLDLARGDLAFSDTLHDREGKRRVQSLRDQIAHDIVTAAYARKKRTVTVFDMRLRISEVDIRAVGKTGNLDKLGHGRGLCLLQHADDELRSELRNSECARGHASDVFRPDSEGLRTLEDTHDLRIVQRNLHRIDACNVLQEADHGRIIMSENIQLQKIVIDRMIIKMGGDDIRRHIIRRMLHRRKRINVLTHRENNDSSRMLAG